MNSRHSSAGMYITGSRHPVRSMAIGMRRVYASGLTELFSAANVRQLDASRDKRGWNKFKMMGLGPRTS
eukprot:scaffold2535_cov336-Prasinococcus_capsulatus_cf.AAC.12